MIASNDVKRDVLSDQPRRLCDKKQTGLLITPVAVIQIARNDNEIDLGIDGNVNKLD
jgi:hypothetical protein